MVEMVPAQRYAVGALLALALHQAELYRQEYLSLHVASSVPSGEKDSPSEEVDYDERANDSWTHFHCGLLRPVFRRLKIDPKAWPGLEQTALSSDAKHHIGAFLRILSEEEEEEATVTSELSLDEAVDAVALSIEQSSSMSNAPGPSHLLSNSIAEEDTSAYQIQHNADVHCDSNADSYSKNYPLKNIEASISSPPYIVEDKLEDSDVRHGVSIPSFPNKKNSEMEFKPIMSSDDTQSSGSDDVLKTSYTDSDLASADTPISVLGEKALLKENYFGSSISRDKAGISRSIKDEDAAEMHGNGCEVILQHKRQGTAYDLTVIENEITESKLLTKRRKTSVLYELLGACVADIPEAEAEKSRLRNGYDARHRTALRLLTAWLDVNWKKVGAMEIMLAYSTMAVQEENEASNDDVKKRSAGWDRWKRGGLIGAAALTGGALLAITGGLAAPAIAAGLSALAPTLGTIVPIIGSSGFAAAAAAAATTAGSVAVAASFGAAGAGLTGLKMARRTGGVDEFGFEGVGENHQQGRLAVGIFVSGFINDPEDFTQPWKDQDNDLERYALRWETKILITLSTAIQDWLKSSFTKEFMKQGAMMTVLSTLLAALSWPSALLTLTDFIDSKWAVAVDRSDKAGKLLAEVLMKGLQGNRPVTLIGFSLGARVIFKCLEKLAKNGEDGIPEPYHYTNWTLFPTKVKQKTWVIFGDVEILLKDETYGNKVVFKGIERNGLYQIVLYGVGRMLEGRIVESVVLLGSPLTLERQRWETVRKVVAGRFVNAFSTNDWLLGVVYRASLLSQGLAGIQEVNVRGIENVDLTGIVKSHSSYLSQLPAILQYMNIDSYNPMVLLSEVK